MKKSLTFTKLAVAAWFVSLALPTLQGEREVMLGYEVLLKGAWTMAYIFIVPFHALSWTTNFLFFHQLWRVTTSGAEGAEPPNQAAIGGAFLLNFFVGLTFGGVKGSASMHGLMANPGFYVWLASFLFLAVAALREESLLPINPKSSGFQNGTEP
jgi:hypothetical protein